MIKYDSESLYNRALERLQQNPDWEAISSDSVIESLLKTNAEMNAETARYGEYLFNESKWDSAQNRSSIVAMAGMLGYKPKRARSATGPIAPAFTMVTRASTLPRQAIFPTRMSAQSSKAVPKTVLPSLPSATASASATRWSY